VTTRRLGRFSMAVVVAGAASCCRSYIRHASTATGQTTNFVFLQSLEGHLRDPPEANLVSYWLFAALRVCLLLEGSLICPAKRQADFALSRDHGCWIQGTTLA
jgi:hypothetical protein